MINNNCLFFAGLANIDLALFILSVGFNFIAFNYVTWKGCKLSNIVG